MHMTSRESFLKTMRYEKTDRVPYFEEGIRKDVIKAWRKQGLTKKAELSEMFSTDRREEIETDLEPRPGVVASNSWMALSAVLFRDNIYLLWKRAFSKHAPKVL